MKFITKEQQEGSKDHPYATWDSMVEAVLGARPAGKFYHQSTLGAAGANWSDLDFILKGEAARKKISWKQHETIEVAVGNESHMATGQDVAAEDAYGERRKVKKEVQQVTHTDTFEAFFSKYFKQLARSFFIHREIAHWQAAQFDACVDGLCENHIAILIDFSMNYSHAHLEEVGGEHWAHHQTTVVPVVVYRWNKATQRVDAHSTIVTTAGIKHSNNMIQYINNETIR